MSSGYKLQSQGAATHPQDPGILCSYWHPVPGLPAGVGELAKDPKNEYASLNVCPVCPAHLTRDPAPVTEGEIWI